MEQDAESWFERGKQQGRAGDFEGAIASFDQLIHFKFDDYDAWVYRGIAFGSLGRYEEAIASCDQAVSLKPDFHDAWVYRGAALSDLGRHEEAIASYDQAIYLKPDFHDAWVHRGVALGDLGRHEEAIASFDRAIHFKPDDYTVWHNRGAALYDLGRFEEAIASYDQVIRFMPNEHEAWNSRGIALIKLGRYVGAIASYDQAIHLKPDFHDAWSSRGYALDNLGRYEEAIASYDQAIHYKPNDYHIWTNRGVVLDNLGRFEEAIASYNQAIRYEPNDYLAWFEQGITLDHLGQSEEAIANFDQAIRFKPNIFQVWYSRGVTLNYLGRWEEAIASDDQAICINPDYHYAWINRGIAAGNSIQSATAHFSSIVQQNPALNQRGYPGKLACYTTGLKYIHQENHPQGWGLLHQAIGKAHFDRGRFDRSSIYLPSAIRSFRTALQTLTPETFPEDHLKTIQILISAYLVLGDADNAQSLRIHGLEIFRQLLNATPSPVRKRQLTIKFASFRQVVIDSLVQDGELNVALEAADRDKNFTLTWILEAWKEDIWSPSYSEMLSLLDASTAAVYWHLSPDALTTFVLRANATEAIAITPTTTRQQLQAFETWLKEWNRDYQDYREKKKEGAKNVYTEERQQHPWRTHLTTRLETLKDILQIPILEQELAGITRLILLPHRDLHRFPLQALFDPRFTITYLPSLQVGLSLQQRASGQDAHLTGDAWQRMAVLSVEAPASENLPGLPFAELESAIIQRLFQTVTPIKPHQSTQAKVIARLEQNHSIFHFTGHGFFNDRQPQNSALALTGSDRLTAQTIHTLNLSNYVLASLAACETSLTGNPTLDTEYVGLVSAFLKAGVAHVISSLWTVEDAANAWIMIRLYQLLFQGEAIAVALKNAQSWLRTVTYAALIPWLQDLLSLVPPHSGAREFLNNQIRLAQAESGKIGLPFDDPYYWAAFTLAGQIT